MIRWKHAFVLLGATIVSTGAANAAPRWDANGDGRMDRAEFVHRASARLMHRADADKDGKLSLAEWRARRALAKAANDPARRFGRLDGNRDGYLEVSELDPVMERRFERRDANGDGVLAKEERQARKK